MTLPITSQGILFTTTAITLAAILLSAPTASADTPQLSQSVSQIQTPSGISINDAESGSLMLRTDTPGRYIPAPMIATDVVLDIAGPIIRSTVSQTFENTSDEWVEGVYVFPLPENAAVDHLRMVIGDRMIEGQIKEKVEAKKIYEAAKAQGKKASLVEQQRPNIFTASVANIGPGERVSIQIEYQDKADIKDGMFAARFPMVVAPRFSPEPKIIEVASVNGVQMAVLDPVLDRKSITPPLKNPAQEPIEYMRLPVTMTVNLDAGFDLDTVTSPYHDIQVAKIDADSVQVQLSGGKVPANRDFLLEWSAQETDTPYSALFTQTIGNDTYLLSMLTPPKSSTGDVIAGHDRESVFVIDTSGSMGGTSIEQARASLLLGLDHLESGDTFNIIRFSSGFSSLHNTPVKATQDNIAKARKWVSKLEADGGTNMAPALAAAFGSKTKDSEERLRQIIFITDGAIGNERQLFAQIKDDLDTARLFPVGIGSAPNSYFMSRAAKFGRGSFVQIGDINEVTSRMGTLFAAIDNPVLTNLTLSLPAKAASYPSALPDVYQTDPVISISKIKTSQLPRNLKISGQLAADDWSLTQDVTMAQNATGLSVLWARSKIADLEESRFDRANAATIDAEILTTALEHHLVSRLTSLVAVDVEPSRPSGSALTKKDVPTMLPEGWDFAKLKGEVSPARKRLKASAGSAQYASKAVAAAPQQDLALPGTASPHQWLAILGALFMMMGLGLSKFRRPQIF